MLRLPPYEELQRVTDFNIDDSDSRNGQRPAILSGSAAQWPAVSKWDPDFFRRDFGDVVVTAYRDLPPEGIPYFNRDQGHRNEMTVGEFIDILKMGNRCYIESMDVERFASLESDSHFERLGTPGSRFVKMWIGCGTRSGLHYDPRDNFLAQIYGSKTAYLVPPTSSHCLYPFGDDVTKSQVDPENPDLDKYPRFARAQVLRGELSPGDVLFIPKGWWHYIVAPDVSISINCWYGDAMSLGEFARSINAADRLLWLRIGRDFIWHGLLGRRFQKRLFCTPPTGKIVYDMFTNRDRTRTRYQENKKD